MSNLKGIIKTIFVIGVVLVLQSGSILVIQAQDTVESQITGDKVPVITPNEQKNELFLMQIRKQLQNAKYDYFSVGNSISEAKEKLVQVTEAITSLKGQLENLEYLISNTAAKIRNVEKQIAQKENQLEVIQEDIKIKEIEIENQKLLLQDYLKLLYLQENTFYDRSDENNLSVSKLLLSEASVGETFQEIQYFTILEQTGENIFNKIDDLKAQLESKQDLFKETRVKLARLNIQLIEEKKSLKIQRNAKVKLLDQTKGEEEIYRQLIAESKRQQLELVDEINALKGSLGFIEQKIKEEGDNFNPDKYGNLINPNVRAIYDFEMSSEYLTGEKLNWPVNPVRGISAYFHDSSYKATFGIPHNAIDIPIPHGTAIRAPAAGVVYKVRDKGDASYSYLIIAHKGGTLTVFGHMSEILVKEREIILPGEIIGLSGGTPGTKGAGYLTTGAHLHFEVIQSGKHIDPLLVLNLEKINKAYLPAYLRNPLDEEEEEKTET